jgi:oxygen-independent coproporphyrinogen-3 oxidase
MIDFKYLKLLNNQESLSLYVHIPFCQSKCYYCAFYSEDNSCWDEENIKLYLDKLHKELDLLKSNYSKTFETVFIGGGNPGVLSVAQLRDLLINIGPSKETTFEINPESLTNEHLSLFKEGLATRVSIGIQSFNDNILKILGRGARKKDNLKALEFCNKLDLLDIDISDNYFIKNNIIKAEKYLSFGVKIKYSFDLMSALPTQKLQDCIEDINILINNCSLKHLSLYCLSVEEGTYLYSLVKKQKIKKNSDLFEKDILENLWKYLNKLGFEHYEISNFAKEDNKCLHNLRYWTLSPYISLGSSAASTIYDNDKLIRLTNISNKENYINSDLFDYYEEEILDKNQFLDEYLIVSLRNKKGLNFHYLKNKFNISKDVVTKAFSKIDSNYYIVDKDTIKLSEEGFLLLDTIILDISLAFEDLVK